MARKMYAPDQRNKRRKRQFWFEITECFFINVGQLWQKIQAYERNIQAKNQTVCFFLPTLIFERIVEISANCILCYVDLSRGSMTSLYD